MLWSHAQQTESGKEEAPEKSGVGVRRARDGGRGGKDSEIGADGCINRKAERSRGRLSIPTGEGEFERSLPPRRQATGKRKNRKGYGERAVNAPWVSAWHWPTISPDVPEFS